MKHTGQLIFSLLFFVLLLIVAAGCGSDDEDTATDGDGDTVVDGDEAEDGDFSEDDETDGDLTDGDIEDGDADPVDGDEVDGDQAEEDSDGDEDAEFNPGDIDFEADIPEFETYEPGACELPVGTDRCRWCGLPCEGAIDCPNGYNCVTGECTRECWPDQDTDRNDCGDGWSCHLQNFQMIGYASAYYCQRGSGGGCTDAESCPDGEICGKFWPNWDWSDIEPFCTAPLPCGAGDGEPCTSGDDCASGVCRLIPETGKQACTIFCDDDSDCAEGRKCRDNFEGRFFYYPGQLETPKLYQPQCTDPNQGLYCDNGWSCGYPDICKSDVDCTTEGEVCGSKQFNDEFKAYQTTCAKPIPGGLDFGESCSFDPGDNAECANTLCIPDEGENLFCSKTCDLARGDRYAAGNPDCPAGYNCYNTDVGANPYVQLGRLFLDVCAPQKGSFAACQRNSDCSDGEICSALTEVPVEAVAFKLDGDGDSEAEEPPADGDGEEPPVDGDAEETPVDGDTDQETNPTMRLQGHCVPGFGDRAVGDGCSTATMQGARACVTGFCLQWSTCSALCVEDADCPEDWFCREQPAYREGGVWEDEGYTVQLCVPGWALGEGE